MKSPLYIPLLCLLLLTTNGLGESRHATLLYVTDAHQIHPVRDEAGDRGGVARLATVIQEARRENPEALFLFGGDLAGGVLFGAVYQGMPMVEAFNELELDAATFGQHDFDFGSEHTLKLVQASSFPWFSSNLVDGSGAPFGGLDRTLVFERGGIRIGLIGLTDAMETTTRDGSVLQLDLLEAAKTAVAELAEDTVDVIVVLSQTPLEVNEQLLTANAEIDAIFSEERRENRTTALFVGDRPIITPCGNIGSVARLDLTLHEDGQLSKRLQALPVDSTAIPDSSLQAMENYYSQDMVEKLSEPLARLLTPLETGMYRDHRARRRESNSGNLIADAFRAAHNADIGMIHGGGIRANVEAGQFTRKDALALLPFGNRVLLLKMKGHQVRSALEYGTTGLERSSGRLLQVSGLRYTINPENEEGERVLSVRTGRAQLADDLYYSVAVPDYLVKGGDGFTAFGHGDILVGNESAPLDVETLIQYAVEQDTLNPKTEGRIQLQRE